MATKTNEDVKRYGDMGCCTVMSSSWHSFSLLLKSFGKFGVESEARGHLRILFQVFPCHRLLWVL